MGTRPFKERRKIWTQAARERLRDLHREWNARRAAEIRDELQMERGQTLLIGGRNFRPAPHS